MKLQDYPNAIKYYSLAMTNPELKWAAYFKLGRAYALNKNWDTAEEIYKKLLDRDPSNKSLKVSLAYITAMQGDSEKAMNMYEKLVSEYPNDSAVLKNYIVLLYSENKIAEVKSEIQKYNKLFDTDDEISQIQQKIDAAQNPSTPPVPPEPGNTSQADGTQQTSE